MNTIRNQYEQAQLEVVRLTKMSKEKYNNLLFETGIEYLKAESNGDEQGISLMSKTEVYWKWWRNVWGNRDLYWLEMVKEGKCSCTEKSYASWQSIEKIDSYPTTMIYQQSYSRLMNKIS